MLEMAINNVELGSLKDRVHIVTFCETYRDFPHSRQDQAETPPRPPCTRES